MSLPGSSPAPATWFIRRGGIVVGADVVVEGSVAVVFSGVVVAVSVVVLDAVTVDVVTVSVGVAVGVLVKVVGGAAVPVVVGRCRLTHR